MWIIMAKGKTYYVEHVDANIPWTTKETPENVKTKGAIKFKDCLLTIDDDNCATISVLTNHDISRLHNKEKGITRVISGWGDSFIKILKERNIKHTPVRVYFGGCGTRYFICDIINERDLTVLGLMFTGKYSVVNPNEVLYKWYDDPKNVVVQDSDYEDDDE